MPLVSEKRNDIGTEILIKLELHGLFDSLMWE